MPRVLCVWLPNFRVQRLQAERPELNERPCVVYRRSGSGAVVVACCERALQAGVLPGMPLTEAQMLLSNQSATTANAARSTVISAAESSKPLYNTACFFEEEREADQSTLQKLAQLCTQFTPWVGIEPFTDDPYGCLDSLLLDITGCAHLFGGEWRLAGRIAMMLHNNGFVSRLGLAGTVGAAWALAHWGAAVEQRPRRLSGLSIEALRLNVSTAQTLHQLGLHTIGQLESLPRESLLRRFGSELLTRLDQFRGRIAEPVKAIPLPEPLEAVRVFDYPVKQLKAVEAAIRELLQELMRKRPHPHVGLLRVQVTLAGEAGAGDRSQQADDHSAQTESETFCVGVVEPSVSVEHWMELILLHLERRRRCVPVTAVQVRVEQTAPMSDHQLTLFGSDPSLSCSSNKREGQRQWAELLDRLAHRLGPSRVLRPCLRPEAQPELAVEYKPLLSLDRTKADPGFHSVAGVEKQRPRTNQLGRISEASRLFLSQSQRQTSSALLPSLRKTSLSDCVPNGSLALGSRPLLLREPAELVKVVSVVPEGPPLRVWMDGRLWQVIRSWGPERIQTGWWRHRLIRRDYFRVELSDGRHVWLFRDIDSGQWFLHGVFD